MNEPDLLTRIEQAFAGVPRKHGITLHEAEAIDYDGDDRERRAARAKDTDANWQDVPDEWLDNIAAAPFLDALGLRYYLPACMRMIVRRGRGHFSGSMGPYGFMTMLATPPKDFVNLLDADQRRTVSAFLQWASEGSEFAQEAKVALPVWREFTAEPG